MAFNFNTGFNLGKKKEITVTKVLGVVPTREEYVYKAKFNSGKIVTPMTNNAFNKKEEEKTKIEDINNLVDHKKRTEAANNIANSNLNKFGN